MGLAQPTQDIAGNQISTQAALLPGKNAPIVIVGAGPVGVRMLRELRRELPQQHVIIYGDERYDPYNRVQLSGLLAGQHRLQDIALAKDLLEIQCPYTEFRGERIISITSQPRLVHSEQGQQQAFSKLVLATGSRPFVPDFINRDMPGVYTFRDMADAEKLAARRVQSTHTVVLGAGLLGIEAARGMQRHNTRVTLIDHNPHPMFRQLDPVAGDLLAQELHKTGIALLTGNSIRQVLGTGKLEGLVLRDGTRIDCDTLICATGIRPNRELAEQAGLAYGRGITVDSSLKTSHPDIYAVGECCELQGELFGLVAPGFEQAATVARNIAKQDEISAYHLTVPATSLKVAGLAVFSMGEADPPGSLRSVNWRDGNNYRRLTLSAGRLVSINAIGDWAELPALRDLAKARKWLPPWQLWRFARSGNVLGESTALDVSTWPDSAVVCNCNAVAKGDIRQAIEQGACSLQAVNARTQAGTGCGSCQPLLQEMLGGEVPREPVKGASAVLILGTIALLGVALAATFAAPYPDTVQLSWDWGELWRVELNKQITGFTILGLCVASLLFSLRKRVRGMRLGNFDWWRLAHIALTALAFIALGLHTGFRMGSQLNLALSLTFVALLLAGSLLAISIAYEHKLAPARAQRLRSLGLWSHILLSWPLPALLSAHILKSYYF